jgi:hypothetical protein
MGSSRSTFYNKGELPMASNFRISRHIDNGGIHLRLTGDFDGTSAHELLNTIKDFGDNINNIFIHTNGLKTIYPFGSDLFQNNLHMLSEKSRNLKFIGKKGQRIDPCQN